VNDQWLHGDEVARVGLRPLTVELEDEPCVEHEEAVAVLAVEMRVRSASPSA
jgi:hypothetical protein